MTTHLPAKTSRAGWHGYLGIVLLTILMVLAAVWGMADVFRTRADLLLGVHNATPHKTPLTKALVTDALDTLSTALRFDPFRPDLHAFKADTHALLVSGTPIWETEAKTHNRLALEYYRAAITRRPSWPHTWAALSVVKFRLAELDEEFSTALEQAATLGPWEPEIQLTVADLGLASWLVLPESTRLRVRETIQRGIVRQGVQITRLALNHRRVDVIAPLIQGNEALEAIVKSGPAGKNPRWKAR